MVYVFCGLCAGIAGLMISSNVSSADGNNAGLLDRARRDPRRRHRRHVAGRRPVLPRRHRPRRALIQTLTTTVYTDRHPAGDHAAVQGARRHRRLPDPVRRLPRRRCSGRRRRRAAAAGPATADVETPDGGGRHDARVTRRAAGAADACPPKYIPVLATLALLVRHVRRRRRPLRRASPTTRSSSTSSSTTRSCSSSRSGMTFVILTGGIDLSVGSVVALTTMMSRVAAPDAGLAAARWCCRWCCSIGATLGFAMGCVIHYFEIQPFIVTLAGHVPRPRPVLRDQHATRSRSPTRFWTRGAGHDPLRRASSSRPSVVIALVVVAGRRRTCCPTPGSAATSTRSAATQQSALLMGLPVGRTKIAVYTISGFCSALGGVLLSLLHALRLRPARDRHGARRDRRGRHRRHPAHRRLRLRVRHRARRAGARPDPDASSPSRARSAPGGPRSSSACCCSPSSCCSAWSSARRAGGGKFPPCGGCRLSASKRRVGTTMTRQFTFPKVTEVPRGPAGPKLPPKSS